MTAVNVPESTDGRDATGKWTSGPGNRGRPLGAKGKLLAGVHKSMTDLTGPALSVIKYHIVEEKSLKAALWLMEKFTPQERLIDVGSTSAMDWADAMAEGVITISEAQRAASALKVIADTDEVRILRDRIDEIEHLLSSVRKP